MKNQCYICQQNFETKEKLFSHLDIHARLKSRQPSNPEPIQEPKAQEPTHEPKPEPPIKKKGNLVICSDCGTQTIVPFKPKKDRPVYCKECLMVHKTNKLKELANEISLEK